MSDLKPESSSSRSSPYTPGFKLRTSKSNETLMERKRKRTSTAGTPSKIKKKSNSGIGIDNSLFISQANSSGEDVPINYGPVNVARSEPDTNAPPNGNAYNVLRGNEWGYQVINPASMHGGGYDLVGRESSFDMPHDMMATFNDTFMSTLDQPYQSSGWGVYMNGASDLGLSDGSDHHQDMYQYPMDLTKNFDGSGIGSDLSGQDETVMGGIDVADEEAAMVGAEQAYVKDEEADDGFVSLTPAGNNDEEASDYDEDRPSKVPKLNKDGIPRKPRRPRAKLLKWSDNDWKNVALGIVWACGEAGISIPFDQASQVVSESCTAGAMQQALLKLRGKQIADGYQIPSLKMAWTRKNKKNSSSTPSANIKSEQGAASPTTLQPKKRSTRMVGDQTMVITLKRAYTDADRQEFSFPYTGDLVDVSTPNMGVSTPFSMSPAGSSLIASPASRSRHRRKGSIDWGNRANSYVGELSQVDRTPATTPQRGLATVAEEDVEDEVDFYSFARPGQQGPVPDFNRGYPLGYNFVHDPFA
jgi:hypothetical protein